LIRTKFRSAVSPHDFVDHVVMLLAEGDDVAATTPTVLKKHPVMLMHRSIARKSLRGELDLRETGEVCEQLRQSINVASHGWRVIVKKSP